MLSFCVMNGSNSKIISSDQWTEKCSLDFHKENLWAEFMSQQKDTHIQR